MTEDEFWEMTPRAFFNAIEGFNLLKKEDYELRRLQTFAELNVWGKIPDPKSLWKYPWEMEEEKRQVNKIEIENQREKAIKLVHTLRNRS